MAKYTVELMDRGGNLIKTVEVEVEGDAVEREEAFRDIAEEAEKELSPRHDPRKRVREVVIRKDGKLFDAFIS